MRDLWLQSVQILKGVGPAKVMALQRLNVHTLGDVLQMTPYIDKYQDRRFLKNIAALTDGMQEVFAATVMGSKIKTIRKKMTVYKLLVQDDTGTAEIVWFNRKHIIAKYKPGMKIIVAGKVKQTPFGVEIHGGEIDTQDKVAERIGDIVPVYPATESLSQDFLRGLVKQVLAMQLHCEEILPDRIIREYKLMSRAEAWENFHFPKEWDKLNHAKYRLVFEELFLLQCLLLLVKRNNQKDKSGIRHDPDKKLSQQASALLPYQLTSEQLAALQDIKQDMEAEAPMQRLLQGDVGSGKTVVAGLALIKTVENGYQGVIMTPTEILAEQHYQTLSHLFAPIGVKCVLLTGRLPKARRDAVIHSIQSGVANIIVGTQALLQIDVIFHKLGLVITDEQHRFGVRQRAILQEKGKLPDVLVMTATPIPRTMALTIYGDLDISAIKEKPPGRKPIRTLKYSKNRREEIYQGIVRQVEQGRQAYIVCPLVEDSEQIESESAVSAFKDLTQTYLKSVTCGLVHGKLNQAEKEQVMRDFSEGKINVLIATSVIEVGINVPNATVMVIEGAERFGLAQLHQLRGRVGRGEYDSFCVLISDADNEETVERLHYLTEFDDGFILAEKDLLLRGPGQFLGTKQHGVPELKIADIVKDTEVFLQAREAALIIIAEEATNSRLLAGIQLHFRENYHMIVQA